MQLIHHIHYRYHHKISTSSNLMIMCVWNYPWLFLKAPILNSQFFILLLWKLIYSQYVVFVNSYYCFYADKYFCYILVLYHTVLISVNFPLSVKTSQMNIFLNRISWVLQYLSYNVNSLHFWGSSSEFTSIKNNQKNMYDRRQRFNSFLWRYNWYILHLTYTWQISSNLAKIQMLSSTIKVHFC